MLLPLFLKKSATKLPKNFEKQFLKIRDDSQLLFLALLFLLLFTDRFFDSAFYAKNPLSLAIISDAT